MEPRNFNKDLVDFDGMPLMEEDTPVTIKKMCVSVLCRDNPNVKPLTPLQKMQHYELARLIHNATEPVRIDVDQAKMLKDLLGIYCSPLVYGQLCEFLEASEPLAPHPVSLLDQNGVHVGG